jgi:hypothetical protein
MERLPFDWIKILEKLWAYVTYLVACLVFIWLFYFLKNTLESNNYKIIKMQQEIRKILE